METKQTNNTGSLRVSEEVVAKIAMLAASEVEGVALEADGKRLSRVKTRSLAGKVLRPSPVKAKLSKETAEIDISVIVRAGHKAAVVGLNLQQAIKTAVQNMTGIAVSKINVKIAGIKLSEQT
ncbi:MAG: Asp23/Gls24 family envelope stress response protein [Oscillospiraceae bacterium]|nr:Asp23/Gls24 family envelope stress response protein [Oscillospiraceae bacterium]